MSNNFRKPDEPQIVIVDVNWPYSIIGFINILLAITVFGIQWQFNNDHVDVAEQACPAPSIFSFVTTARNLLLFSGLVDLAICGFFSQIYSSLERVEEAIFFGHFFMGVFGQVFRFTLDFSTVAYNTAGLVGIIRGQNVSPEFDSLHPETYCHVHISNAAKAIIAIVFLSAVAHLIFVLKSYFQTQSKSKVRPVQEVEAQIEMRGIKRGKRQKFKNLKWGGFQPDEDIIDDIYNEQKPFEPDEQEYVEPEPEELEPEEPEPEEAESEEPESDEPESDEPESDEPESDEPEPDKEK